MIILVTLILILFHQTRAAIVRNGFAAMNRFCLCLSFSALKEKHIYSLSDNSRCLVNSEEQFLNDNSMVHFNAGTNIPVFIRR